VGPPLLQGGSKGLGSEFAQRGQKGRLLLGGQTQPVLQQRATGRVMCRRAGSRGGGSPSSAVASNQPLEIKTHPSVALTRSSWKDAAMTAGNAEPRPASTSLTPARRANPAGASCTSRTARAP